MIKKYAIAGIAAFLSIISTNVLAAEKQKEVSIFGYYNKPTEPAGQDPTLLINLSEGIYFTDKFLGTLTMTALGSGNFTSLGVGLGVKYYFSIGKTGDFVPFVVADFMLTQGYLDMTATSTDTLSKEFVFGVGGSYFINETASFDTRFVHRGGTTDSTTDRWTFPYGSSSSSYDSASNELTVGFTQRF